jgi:hypothetical protein
MSEFVLEMPRNWLPPQRWRTRFAELQRLLDDPDSRLVAILRDARATPSELEKRRRLKPIFDEYGELFPGEAGRRVVWEILVGGRPFRFRPGPGGAIIDVFDEPTDAYRASFTGEGRNRFSSRNRGDDKTRRLLELLAGTDDRPPMTMLQAARTLRMTSKQFATRTSALRRRGLQIRSSWEQSLVAKILAFDELKCEFDSARPADFETVPARQIERRTNYSLDRLRNAAGPSRCFTQSNIHDAAPGIEVVRVPRALLDRRDRSSSPTLWERRSESSRRAIR